jgi:hypothetical protein
LKIESYSAFNRVWIPISLKSQNEKSV